MPIVKKPNSPLVPMLAGLHLFHFDGAPCFALAEKGIHRGPDLVFTADDAISTSSPKDQWASRIVSLIKKDHLTEAYAKIQPNLVVPAFRPVSWQNITP